jgi:hypothetical protein
MSFCPRKYIAQCVHNPKVSRLDYSVTFDRGGEKTNEGPKMSGSVINSANPGPEDRQLILVKARSES